MVRKLPRERDTKTRLHNVEYVLRTFLAWSAYNSLRPDEAETLCKMLARTANPDEPKLPKRAARKAKKARRK